MKIQKLIEAEFSRNIGLVSESDQAKLLQSRAAVAGAGGVGGIHILTLARLGVGKFNIADLDEFEPANISRQFGAYQSTLGRHKAEVLAEMVLDINPEAEVKVFSEGINRENVDDFLKDATVYIDGIEFFEIEIRRLLFAKAKQAGIYALTAAPLGFGATLEVFSPTGMSFDEYFGLSDDMEELEKIAAFMTGLAPTPFHSKYLDVSKVSFKKRRGPAVAPACTLAAALVATEVTKIVTGVGQIKPVPHYLQLDMRLGKWKKGYIPWGGKNPLQRLKRKMAERFLAQALSK